MIRFQCYFEVTWTNKILLFSYLYSNLILGSKLFILSHSKLRKWQEIEGMNFRQNDGKFTVILLKRISNMQTSLIGYFFNSLWTWESADDNFISVLVFNTEKQWGSRIINPLFFEPFISQKFTFICQIIWIIALIQYCSRKHRECLIQIYD